ncbi:hypothetical protein ZWY2020_038440 [Hordeum vulgare]|nr:hypothetical protein ZWY2020_038440 [Hordeum vulgare]
MRPPLSLEESKLSRRHSAPVGSRAPPLLGASRAGWSNGGRARFTCRRRPTASSSRRSPWVRAFRQHRSLAQEQRMKQHHPPIARLPGPFLSGPHHHVVRHVAAAAVAGDEDARGRRGRPATAPSPGRAKRSSSLSSGARPRVVVGGGESARGEAVLHRHGHDAGGSDKGVDVAGVPEEKADSAT